VTYKLSVFIGENHEFNEFLATDLRVGGAGETDVIVANLQFAELENG
ncbi:hypothetical protein THOM_1742, partial [Trachipleistophora hominis]